MREPIWKKNLQTWHHWYRVNSFYLASYEQVRQELVGDLRSNLESRLGRSNVIRRAQEATAAARLWRQDIERLLAGSELRTKYDAIAGVLPDRWRLRQYAFDDGS